MNEAYIERRDYLKAKLLSLGFELEAQLKVHFIFSQVLNDLLIMILTFVSMYWKKHMLRWFQDLLYRYRKRLYSYFLCL